MVPDSRSSGAAEPSGAPSRAAVRSYVRGAIAQVIGCTVHDLADPDALRSLNMDSVTRMNITVHFDQALGDIPPTLMFECQTVDELATYLLENHRAQLLGLIPKHESPAPPTGAPPQPGDRRSDPTPASSEIAVVAITGRYPGAPDVESLWRCLRDGLSSISEVPKERWDWRQHFDPRRGRPDTTYGRWGGFIDGVAEFDADFFNILPRDAANMDPQERLFLQACWHLLEQAGRLSDDEHEPATGVFVGTMNATYGKIGATGWPLGRLVGPNSAAWSIANRVSYFFDLHGPSFAVDSACSSSLAAVHLACESLRRGECRAAIAGGVNLILHPAHLVGLSASGMLSSDSACKVFDVAADGLVPGEGVGAVLLKPLAAAVADHDHIWGVIKGSAVNTAGRTSGYSVPSPARQAELVAAALANAGVEPASISYVEAHGTGTALGDPVEIAGLDRALAPGRGERGPCAVGSIKANIGHLEGASGIAGLTKVLLQLKYRQIAPCVSLNQINPKITPSILDFPRSLQDWQVTAGHPRRAGVSSFGAGGANAHLVVEEFVSAPTPEDEPSPCGTQETEHLVLLSARTRAQLNMLATSLARTLPAQPDESYDLERLAYSTQIGRRAMTERLAVLTQDLEALRASLEAFVSGEQSLALLVGTVRPEGGRANLLDDEDGQAYVAALARRRRLDRIAGLWVEGVPVDWSLLWGQRVLTRVDLPPYPFEPTLHWTTAADGPAVPAPPTATAAAPGQVDQDPPDPSTPARDRYSMVERELRLAACGFLLVDPRDVDMTADLMELGFDSISLIQLFGQISEMYDVDLDPVVIFDHPTLAALCGFLISEHPIAVENRYRQVTEA